MKRTTFWAGTLRGGLILAVFLAALLPRWIQGQVIITEILVDNNSVPVPDYTNITSWAELYNAGTVDIDLGGWHLTDKVSTPTNFTFAPGTMLYAESTLIVFLDNKTNATGIHAGFSLKKSGDDLTLFYPGGLILADQVVFGMQLPDLSIGRQPDFSLPFQLNIPSPTLPNELYPGVVPGSPSSFLRINEWMANPSGGDDWFELYNGETNIVNMSGLVWSDRGTTPATNRALPQLSFISPFGFIQFFADDLSNNDFDHVDFKLSSGSDHIYLYATDRSTTIDHVFWTTNQLNGASVGRMPDGSTNIVGFAAGKSTPGASNFELITNVVINEILSHTDPPLEDAIEFYNPTATDVNIGNWWLSNSRDVAKKHRIAPNTVIPALGYKVIYETNFLSITNPIPFNFNSAHGDEAYLYAAANDVPGTLLGSRVGRAFDSAENGVSFGRYVTSDAKTDFVAMSRRTFGVDNPASQQQFRLGQGATNVYPKMGPLVINEVMYHPPDIVEIIAIIPGLIYFTNHIDDATNEFVEVYNVASTNVPLYDPAPLGTYYDPNFPGLGIYADGRTNTWKLRGVADYNFPTNVFLAPGKYLLVINFDPFQPTNAAMLAAFRSKFAVPPDVPIFGPYGGKLSNSGGSVELLKPDPPQGPIHPDFRYVPYILVDRVKYSDIAPWPTNCDGRGFSLQRIKPEEYGNDPINWVDGTPSAGRQYLSIESASKQGNAMVLGFTSMASSTYTLQYRNALSPASPWAKAVDLPAQTNTTLRYVTNSGLNGIPNRFYRVVTPQQ